MFGIVNVPAPKQMMTRENIEALTEPSRSYALTKRPGEPATLRIRFPGDIGGVLSPVISSVCLI